MTIILVLAGLVLATSSYVHNKGARSRAEAEIAAMSAALENYKADNGVYPSSSPTTLLNAQSDLDPTRTNIRTPASRFIRPSAAMPITCQSQAEWTIVYEFQAESARTFDTSNGHLHQRPVWKQLWLLNRRASGTLAAGYNPTFDLWSTAGSTTSSAGWIKNW